MERHSSWPHRPSRIPTMEDEIIASGYSAPESSGSSTYGHRGSPIAQRRLALMPGKGRDWRERKKEVPWSAAFCTDERKKKRVMMIEYIKTDITENDKKVTKMNAHVSEFETMVEVEAMTSLDRKDGTVLRVLHVQNNPEAVEFFTLKYRMHDPKNVNGWADIKHWLYHYKPQQRAGKAMPMAKTFKRIQNPGLSKVAWGMDCLKVMPVNYRADEPQKRHHETKVAELMGFEEESVDDARNSHGHFKPDNPWLSSPPTVPPPPQDKSRVPCHTHDIFSQRLSVYLQWVTSAETHTNPIIPPPSRRIPTDVLDTGATIIIFDNSASLSINDTIIPAHGDEERIWRGPGVSYYEHLDDTDTDTDLTDPLDITAHETRFTLDFLQKITETIFGAVADCWEEVLDVCWDHMSILQDKIYEQPADESRAPELFKNAEIWLKLSKLMSFHVECIGDVQEYVGDFGDREDSSEGGRPVYTWLYSAVAAFARLNGYIEDDLIKQTDKLSDLMYKSVGIRDSRDSLRMGESMWRLSWITFIFLPLTFIVGFFGMNVDIFENNPSIKWYFVVSAPFMILVLVGLSLVKMLIARHRPVPSTSQETFFVELQESNADMWGREGARVEFLRPVGLASKLRWYLVKRWTRIRGKPKGGLVDEGTGWAMIKKYLVRKWTSQHAVVYTTTEASDPELVAGTIESDESVDKGKGVADVVNDEHDQTKHRWKRAYGMQDSPGSGSGPGPASAMMDRVPSTIKEGEVKLGRPWSRDGPGEKRVYPV